ncbi:MAG: N-acetylmuramoyl-L-alanine amidase-like domain-containing protein [Rhodothermaceae bacterium]
MIKLLFAFILSGILFGQSVHTDEDVRICNQKFVLANSLDLKEKPINKIFTEIAKSFIGIEYAANTLQNENKEELRIHLTGLDCYTFVEAALVFSRNIKRSKTGFSDFESELENVRYRNGKLGDYTSRLHYFSDWLFEMDKREIIDLVTKDIGGEKYEKRINFMSAHPQYYKELKNNPVFVKKMSVIENEMNKRNYFYINQLDIEKNESKLKSGDIIGITTSIKGLDISHVGIAVKMSDDRIHFLHAPVSGKKIQITKLPLSDYIKKNKKQIGIMVGRIREIKK